MKFAGILLAGLIFVGCASHQNHSTDKSAINYSSIGATQRIKDRIVSDSDFRSFDASCKSGELLGCYNVANYYYQHEDYATAIRMYDEICATNNYPNNLPSCIKMAGMFEKGEGIMPNINTAFDLYKRACFTGDKPSCQDAKRLADILKIKL